MKWYMKAALWLLVLMVCLIGIDQVMRRGDGKAKYDVFYGEKEEFDVFFLGNSHVMDGVYPIELWRDYGFTSFDFGNTGEPMDNTYWTLRIALKYHKPKVAVIDVSYIDRIQSVEMYAYHFAHGFLDEVPLSVEKLRAIWELFPEGKRAEFVFPLSLYHARWEEFLDGLPQRNINVVPCMFGAELRVGRSKPLEFEQTQNMSSREPLGVPALKKIISFCRENEIEPVMMVVPYPASERAQELINYAHLVAEETDTPFLDMMDVPGLVDYQTDCYDEGSHLNPDGATKVTAYLGKWLNENCVLPDRRNDENYAHWNEALEEYEILREMQWGDATLLK